MRWLLLSLGLVVVATLSLGLPVARAASDNFIIRLFAGEDGGPPTTPEISSLTPISSSQIDVVWTAATDDIILSGYRLFRDSVQIATTTLTSYSDTGLTASTSYTYTVDAFDSFNNISSTSVPVSTTTPAIVIPPVATTSTSTSGESSIASVADARLESLTVTALRDRATINWQTSTPTKYIIRWGRTTSYELGAVSGGVYKRIHNTTINQLEPGTKYFYELVVINGRDIPGVVSRGNLVTQPAVIIDRPANVLYFGAEVVGESILLNWQNPVTPNFEKVRIVRSHLFYPQTPFDGALVYEGSADTVTDSNALKLHSPQYYTIFVYDSAGNVSSGAIASATLTPSPNLTPDTPPAGATTSSRAPILPPPVDIGDDVILSAVEIQLEQGTILQTLEGKVHLKADESYIVSIPAMALPPHLKTIIVTIQNPSDNRTASAYLLRLNTTGERYEAVVAAPMVSGQARITVEVFDYNAATVRRISNVLIFEPTRDLIFFPDQLFMYPILWLLTGLLTVLSFILFWWFVFGRRR